MRGKVPPPKGECWSRLLPAGLLLSWAGSLHTGATCLLPRCLLMVSVVCTCHHIQEEDVYHTDCVKKYMRSFCRNMDV